MRHVYGFSFQDMVNGVPYVFILADSLQAAVSVYGQYAEFCRKTYDAEFIGPDTSDVIHDMCVAATVEEDGTFSYHYPFSEENFTGGCDDSLANFTLEDGRLVPCEFR